MKLNVVRNIVGQIVNRDTLSGLILIVQNQITSQALKAVNVLSFKVEIFQVRFFMFFGCCVYMIVHVKWYLMALIFLF